jgi:hypothetical protein
MKRDSSLVNHLGYVSRDAQFLGMGTVVNLWYNPMAFLL